MSDERFSSYNKNIKTAVPTIEPLFNSLQHGKFRYYQLKTFCLHNVSAPFCNQINYNSNQNIINEGDFISR